MAALLTWGSFSLAESGPEPKAEQTGQLTLHPRAQISTSLGDIIVVLNAERAPGTALNFVRYVEDKFYDGTIFHRVIKSFMIQGGAYTPSMVEKTEGLRLPIKNEWRNGLKNERGTIAMARLGNKPDSARASFFINVVDNEYLDKPHDGAGYCVFGKVIEGMDVVDKIRDVSVHADPRFDAGREVVPVEPVVITSIRMLDELDRRTARQRETVLHKIVERVAAEEREKVERKITERVAQIEKEKGKKFKKTDSGLLYMDLKEGTGASPGIHDIVRFHYRGYFADGMEFSDSRKDPAQGGQPWQKELRQLIDGWAEGLQSMKAGGKRIMVTPPNLAFGDEGRPGIPAGATLFWEMELFDVIRTQPPGASDSANYAHPQTEPRQ